LSKILVRCAIILGLEYVEPEPLSGQSNGSVLSLAACVTNSFTDFENKYERDR
jgi:hypothetical protein